MRLGKVIGSLFDKSNTYAHIFYAFFLYHHHGGIFAQTVTMAKLEENDWFGENPTQYTLYMRVILQPLPSAP